MSTSRVNYIYDAATSFRAPGAAALTTDTTLTVVPLDKMRSVRPSSQRNKLGAGSYDVVIAIETIAVNTDETYTFNVCVGTAGAPNTVVGSVVAATAGQYVVKLDAGTIEKLDANRDVITVKLDVAGTAPSVKFAAWMV